MSGADQTPPNILKWFVGGLPTTIRDVVIVRCLIAFDAFDISSEPGTPDYIAKFDKLVDGKRQSGGGFRLAAICGVLDMALHPVAHMSQWMKDLAEKYPDNETFNTMALKAPLQDRHWRQAAIDFQKLRDGPLSLPSFIHWDVTMLDQLKIGP